MKWALGVLAGLLLFLPLLLFSVVSSSSNSAVSVSLAGQSCDSSGGGGNYAPVNPKGAAAALTGQQRQIVAAIIGIGKQRRLPPRAWQTAVQAGKVESNLRNLTHGDRDSLGIFQMRPSAGWGSPAQLHDVGYQVGKFYSKLTSTVPGWQSMRPGDAAQAVERSAFPDRYNEQEAFGAAVIKQNGGAVAAGAGGAGGGVDVCDQGSVAPGQTEQAVRFALSQQGKPYVWGAQGPGAFDCSGLMQAAYRKMGITLPRTSHEQYRVGTHIPVQQAKRGDLLFWGYSNADPHTIHHVAMYLGDGRMVEAQQTGVPVKTSKVRNQSLMPTAVTFAKPGQSGGV